MLASENQFVKVTDLCPTGLFICKNSIGTKLIFAFVIDASRNPVTVGETNCSFLRLNIAGHNGSIHSWCGDGADSDFSIS